MKLERSIERVEFWVTYRDPLTKTEYYSIWGVYDNEAEARSAAEALNAVDGDCSVRVERHKVTYTRNQDKRMWTEQLP